MKRSLIVLFSTVAILALAAPMVPARGPGGGGRGGGGGSRGGGGVSRPSPSASRPSPSVSRPSPSASRPSPSAGTRPSPGAGTRPSPGAGTRPGTGAGAGTRPGAGAGAGTRPGTGAGAGARPSKGDLGNFLDLPNNGAGSRPAAGGSRPAAGGGAAADFLQNRPATPGTQPARPGADRPNAGQRPARPATGERPGAGNRPNAGNRVNNAQDRRGRITDNRAGRIDNRQEWRGNRVERRDQVRDHMQRYPLRRDFWQDHPNWGRWAWNRPYRWATWAAVTNWFPWGWKQPVSYAYGENVYYQDDAVYYGDQEAATAEAYAEQAYEITSAAPEATEQEEWMQLGVFAVTQDGEAKGPPPTMFVQLAVSKTGIIAGTFFDQTTEESMEVEGAVDKKSQRTAWVGKGKQWPVMETGISNLTEDAAPALVHFEDGQTQQVLLVRVEEPKAAQE